MSLLMSRRTKLGAAFSPLTLSPVLWLDASQEAYANDAAVTTWTDRSGNGLNAAQGTGTKQPVFKTNIINGKPALLFDGTDDHLLVADHALLDVPYITIFAVFDANDTAAFKQILTRNAAAAWAAPFARYSMRLNVSEALEGWAESADTPPATIFGSTTGLTSPTIGAFRYDGATQAVYVNGPVNGSEARTTGPITASDQPLVIGSRLNSGVEGESFPGYIAEVIIYNTALSTADRTSVTSYLGTKYGITVT